MRDLGAWIFGECSPWPSKDRMAAVLRGNGLDVVVGTYSVRLVNTSGRYFSFELYGGDIGDPETEAYAEDPQELIRDARAVSSALSAADIRHRFEIYDSNDVLIEYLNFEWPMPSNTSLERTRER